MPTAKELETAADAIWRHWQDGQVMSELPANIRPSSRREGYQAQAAAAVRGTPYGWKIAATSKMGQQHIGVDGPLAGRLLKERVHPSGSRISIAQNRMRVAEPEFAFRLGRGLPARKDLYKVADVLDAVDALIPAIEVPDSRFADFAKVGGPQLIADFACARDFVIGEPTAPDWRDLDLVTYKVDAVVPGKLERQGIGSNVLGDPRIALVWLVNELSGLGVDLEKGEIITTGTCMQPIEIVPGDEVRADFGVLGKVAAKFV